jgi:thioredoxin reductase (NADPH)
MTFNLSNLKSESGEPEMTGVENVVIIGSGPAGLSAALYAARAELKPLVLTGTVMGGQASLTHTIENYPGFPEGIGGLDMGELFKKQAERFGARVEFETATAVDLKVHPFEVSTYGRKILAKTIIIATGANPNHLNVPGETEFTGKGVSYCGTCDGWFFKEKNVVVVGGGDSALEEGIFLTRFATSVTIIHRRDELRAGAILQRRAQENPKIRFIWDSVVTEILGTDSVSGVRLKNVKTAEERIFPTNGIFIFIGHKPNTAMLEGQLELDELGYIKSNPLMGTNIPGVFVAGEAADPHYRQVITSAGMGAAAAIMTTRYLESEQ